ncbi:MAG: IS21 family transposase [Bacteroidales bacterium]|nr:IS21 family transposase [Bacteroidales bacterium]
MYKIDMWYTVKTLLDRGKSLRCISQELGISRKTVTKIRDEITKGNIKPPEIKKGGILDDYSDLILSLCEKRLTSVLIHRKLVQEKGVTVSYPTVLRFVNSIKQSEVYVPVELPPAEEAQVDFGYLGEFYKDEKKVKLWVFSMQLSFSRYAYYEITTNQTTATFIGSHINAFEFFGGVPKTVKIDNLKAAVLEANFYEPVFQQQYSEFLSHYNSAPITARVRRGQDKGKVESGIKYVKNNYLKGLGHRDYYKAVQELKSWNINICNTRIHGTTRKVPSDVFKNTEKKELINLPPKRYEIFKIENRVVKPNGHLSFQLNYYSVPHIYANKEVFVKSNENILRVYDGFQQVALHTIEKKQNGVYITIDAHKPPEKRRKPESYYYEKAAGIGPYVVEFLEALKLYKPYTWQRMISGVAQLAIRYDKQTVNMACKRALRYKAISYHSIKNICSKGLHQAPTETLSIQSTNGFNHDLRIYDNLKN